jgi:hypothetical protein
LGLAAEGAVAGLERAGGVGQAAPVEGGGPGQAEDVAGEPGDGAHGLAEVTGLEIRPAAEFLEEAAGRLRGGGIDGRAPEPGPAEEMRAGAGRDAAFGHEDGEGRPWVEGWRRHVHKNKC